MSVLVATMLCHLCLNMISVSEYQCNYELSELRVMLRLKNDIDTVKPRFNGQMRTNDSPLLEKVR